MIQANRPSSREALRFQMNLLAILFDVLAAACILLAVYYCNYLRPYRFSPAVITAPALSEPPFSDMQASGPDTPAPSSTASGTGSAPEASAGGTVSAPADLRTKFASHFSDTIIATKYTYRSPDLSITVTPCSMAVAGGKNANYYVADVYTADLGCFKTYFAQNVYGSGYTERLADMASNVGAILAMNGDTYCYNRSHTAEPLIRNGVLYRDEPATADVCVLYKNGEMRTYSPGQLDLEQAMQDGACQSWVFGPRLLDDHGRAMVEFNTWDYIRESHPRSAIGYYEPGHYCLVVVDGRTGRSAGMTLQELSRVFENLGCVAAYNLDGGHSSMLTFGSRVVNHPYRPDHQLTDCLYFGEAQ